MATYIYDKNSRIYYAGLPAKDLDTAYMTQEQIDLLEKAVKQGVYKKEPQNGKPESQKDTSD
jgi:hypothetical protein